MNLDNREQLKMKALQLLARQGFDAVAVQDIVTEAGVTKPTLYHYFGSKRGLLDALLGEGLAPLQSSLAQAVVYVGDLMMNLRHVVQIYFDFTSSQPDLVRFIVSAQHAPPESESHQALSAHLEQVLGLLTGLFKQAIPHMDDRCERYAITFLGMISTYLTLALQGDLDLDDALVYGTVQQFLHGIYS